MPLALRPGLHCRQVDAAYIFLDLMADRYFMLAGTAAERFDHFMLGAACSSDRQWLRARGLVVDRADECPPPRADFTVPTSSLVDTPRAGASMRVTASSLWGQARAGRDLRRHRLGDIVTELERKGPRTADTDEEICAEVAAAFLRARRYAPAIDRCLACGIAMKRLLIRRRCAASLVFGVTMPFAAHCWVQAGDTILSDPLDIVLHYRPIFAV